jgi:hypothetical protein
LNEIETEEDLNQLSAKQLKDLLAMNRVNFHGVIEKEELLKIVHRLWRQEKKAQQGKPRSTDVFDSTLVGDSHRYLVHEDCSWHS